MMEAVKATHQFTPDFSPYTLIIIVGSGNLMRYDMIDKHLYYLLSLHHLPPSAFQLHPKIPATPN